VELYTLYSSPKGDEMAGHAARMEEKRDAYRVLVGMPEGKPPQGIPCHTWEDNIKMDIREITWSGVDWINLLHERVQYWVLVNKVVNLWVS
jgi:hypothetical protein